MAQMPFDWLYLKMPQVRDAIFVIIGNLCGHRGAALHHVKLVPLACSRTDSPHFAILSGQFGGIFSDEHSADMHMAQNSQP